MLMALLKPFLPVHALALPLLMTVAYILRLATCFLQRPTGAANTLLVVNIAAAVAPPGHEIIPRSSLPDRFTPEASPTARKPFAAVIVLFIITIPTEKLLLFKGQKRLSIVFS
jgi:hypothetical protein